MSEWIPVKIGALFEFSRSGEWGTDTGSGEPVGVLRSVNFSNDGKLNTSDIAYRHLPNAKLEKILMREGDILIEKSGGSLDQPAGRVVLSHINFPCTCSNFISLCRPKDKYDYSFVFYKLFNEYRTGRVVKFQQKTTGIINFKLSEYLDEIIQIPNEKREQTRIARILLCIDETIEKTKASIEKHKAIKQAMMHDLFTRGLDKHGNLRPSQKDAPEFYKKSPLGWIPKEWDVAKIDNIAEYVGSGVTPTGGSAVYKEEGVLFLRSQNIHFNGLHLDDVAFIPTAMHNSMERSKVHSYDILLNITGASIGRCCYFPSGIGEANVNQHVCLIRPKSNTKNKAVYLSTFLASHFGQRQIDLLNAGSNREGLNYQQVRAFDIPIPQEESEINNISNRIETANLFLSKEILAHKKYIALKQSLMSDLLSGEVPVKA